METAKRENLDRLTPSNDTAGRPVTYLHIGAPKSGTTYLQSLLWDNRAALRDDGILYPGSEYLSHTHAALDLQGQRFGDYADPAVPGAWERLIDEVRAWNGTAIISQELFSPASPDAVERAMTALAFSDVHLIYTARDLVRQVPAAWQEDIKNRNTLTFGEFAAALRAKPEDMHPLGTGFWRMQDAADVLVRWARSMEPDRVHLITIPQGNAPRSLLWERFCAVIGIVPERYSTAAATPNTSLGIAEANLLRRLNLELGDDVRWPLYNRCVTGLLGVDLLATRPGRRKIILSGADRAWMSDRCHELVDALREAKYDVVGDLNDLLPDPVPAAASADGSSVPPVHPDDPSETEMLDAAVASMAALLGRLQKWRDEIDRLDHENDVLRADHDTLRVERDRLRAEVEEQREILRKPATKLFVRRLSEKNRAVMRARIIYWNVVEALRRLRRRKVGGTSA